MQPKSLGRLLDPASCPCRRSPLSFISRTLTKRVYCNNRPAAAVQDFIACGAIAITGSNRVFIENRQAHRLKDQNTGCGRVLRGSPDTYVG